MGGTVGFADIYGPPAGGNSIAAGTNPSRAGVGGAAGKIAAVGGASLPLGLPTLIVLGVVAWWLWRVYD
jgi:hypothetical protein